MDNHHQTPAEVLLLTPPPHVLFFPLPLQGPVNCLLKLAEIFCLHRIQVTFLNTDYVQQRLLRYSDISTRFRRYGEFFRFRTVPDGLREDSLRTSEQIGELLESMESTSLPIFREMVRSSVFGLDGSDGHTDDDDDDDRDGNPITCIIADGAFGFAADVAREFGVSIFYFDTISPCAQWAVLNARKLKDGGDYPFKDDDMDAPVTSLPGMEGFLRRRDLPSFFRNSDQNDPIIQRLMAESPMRQAHGLIFNSFADLEGPTLSQLQTLTQQVYAIGPLHTHHKARLSDHQNQEEEASKQFIGNSTNSLWKENKDCISWLDKQPAKSVIYVSIGSLAVMGNEQFMEIWHGIVNSGVRFLWVRRPGSVTGLEQGNGETEIHRNLEQATKERGYIVSWAPQEEVLAHPAVGGFFTHSGWNSTLESIVEGVPMICWPYYADQQMNSRYVGEVWKVGLDMKDTCDRGIVEMMIKEITEDRKNEIVERVEDMAMLAKACVNKGGSSYNDLNRLMEDIKSMSLHKPRVL